MTSSVSDCMDDIIGYAIGSDDIGNYVSINYIHEVITMLMIDDIIRASDSRWGTALTWHFAQTAGPVSCPEGDKHTKRQEM